MSLLLLFQGGAEEAAAATTTGGWLSPEQAAAQLREIRRQEKRETKRKERIRVKARELEETIADAYAKATGKPRLKKALESIDSPNEFTPETIREIGQEIVERLHVALDGSGRRYAQERRMLEGLERALVEFDLVLQERSALEQENEIAFLLMAAV
jgi:hypothetical protein